MNKNVNNKIVSNSIEAKPKKSFVELSDDKLLTTTFIARASLFLSKISKRV